MCFTCNVSAVWSWSNRSLTALSLTRIESKPLQNWHQTASGLWGRIFHMYCNLGLILRKLVSVPPPSIPHTIVVAPIVASTLQICIFAIQSNRQRDKTCENWKLTTTPVIASLSDHKVISNSVKGVQSRVIMSGYFCNGGVTQGYQFFAPAFEIVPPNYFWDCATKLLHNYYAHCWSPEQSRPRWPPWKLGQHLYYLLHEIENMSDPVENFNNPKN